MRATSTSTPTSPPASQHASTGQHPEGLRDPCGGPPASHRSYETKTADEETKTADEETKTSDDETKKNAQTTQLIYEAAVWLVDGLSDGEDAIDDEDGNDAGDDVDFTTGRAVDCTTVCQKRVSPSVEPPLRDFDDESFASSINVLQPLAGVASVLKPAAVRISDPRPRAGLLSLLEQSTSLPAMPREDLQTRLQRTDIVPQAITATGHPPRRPASSRKQRAGRRGLEKNIGTPFDQERIRFFRASE